MMDSTSTYLLRNISNTKNTEVIDDFVPILTHRGNPTVTLNFKTSTVCPYLQGAG